MNKISRRDFLKFIGAGSIGAGAGLLYGKSTKKTVELLLPQVIPPEDYSPGIATWYNTICQQCGAGCGISVRTREGRAKKIEGNSNHPVNQGRLCAMGQAGLNALYNPDRIKSPLKRTGERGNNSFTEISWDEALTTLGSRLGNLKIQKHGDSVYLLTGGVRGHIDKLFATFMEAMGSDNYFHYDFTHPFALYEANRIIFGEEIIPYYDINNANYVLSFGADYLGTWISPVHYSLAYGHLRQGRGNQRGKCVQIEPRMSLTGANADEWITCLPGTEGLLAMGLAHVIMNDGGYTGSDQNEWMQAVTPYSPSVVSRQTGVEVRDITRLAHEFMKHQPGLAIGGGHTEGNTNAVASLTAINALNYLSGNLGKPGGIIFNPEPAFPNMSIKRQANYTQMLELITAMTNKGVDILLVHNTNPVFNLPPAAKFIEALHGVPLLVSLSSFMDETTALADLVLPTHTYLEAWGDDIPEPGVGFPIASISQPVVKPVYNTQSIGDIILALAHQIGGELPVALPWTQTEDYLKDSWKKIYQERTPVDATAGFDDFWKAALMSGVWGENKTRPLIKFDRLSNNQIQKIHVSQPSFAGDEKDYPFVLLPYLTQTFYDGRGANLPWLQELPDPMTSIVYSSWVELNPKTANRLGISEGDVLEVQSIAGTIRAPAFLYPAIRPDVIAMPIGQGHSHYGRYAQNRGVNPMTILAPEVDDTNGALAWSATRVRITKTEERIRIIKTDGVTRTLGRQILGNNSVHT
ncbi:MAG: molybdopterin-dependent oxidoreductase [Gammaproteobacteria bacterium]|nr:molybdopterin-dependent oxidoreductase [Gammaproteobacteria bacterium]